MKTVGYFVLPLYLLVPVVLFAGVAAYRQRHDAERAERFAPWNIVRGVLISYGCMVVALYANDLFGKVRPLEALPTLRLILEPIFPLLAFTAAVFLFALACALPQLIWRIASKHLLGRVWYDVRGHMLAVDARYASSGDDRQDAACRTADGRSWIYVYELCVSGAALPFTPSPEGCAEYLETRFMQLDADCWERVRMLERNGGGVRLLKVVFAERGGSTQVVNDVVIGPAGALLVQTYLELSTHEPAVMHGQRQPWLHYRLPYRSSFPL